MIDVYKEIRCSMMKRIILSAVAVCILAALIPASGWSQGLKVGFVKDEVIYQNYKAFQRAQEQWDLEKKAWDEEAQAKQDEIETLREEYEKQRLILSEEKRKEKEAQIRTKMEALDAFTRQIYGPQGTAEKKNEQLLRPINEAITNAIKAVAEEEGFDIVFTASESGLAYIRESYDITDKVLGYLETTE